MEICVLSIGKISSSWIKEGINDFEARLKKYIKFSTLIISDIKNSKLSKDNIKEEEGKSFLSNINSSDLVIVTDEKGREFTSKDFAIWMQKQLNTGKKRLVILIGGPYGYSKEIYNRADVLLSLSKMTFTHEMAKLFLTEQLYRGMTILKGEPYHHD